MTTFGFTGIVELRDRDIYYYGYGYDYDHPIRDDMEDNLYKELFRMLSQSKNINDDHIIIKAICVNGIYNFEIRIYSAYTITNYNYSNDVIDIIIRNIQEDPYTTIVGVRDYDYETEEILHNVAFECFDQLKNNVNERRILKPNNIRVEHMRRS